MNLQKTAILLGGLSIVLIGGAYLSYRYVSEQAAIEQFNVDHMKKVQTDPNYAGLFTMVSLAKNLESVASTQEFSNVFAECYNQESVQARFLALDNLTYSDFSASTEIASSKDFYGNVIPDTIHHYKADAHTADNLCRLTFDFTENGMKVELNLLDCYRTSEPAILADIAFPSCRWTRTEGKSDELQQDLEDFNGSLGTLTFHLSLKEGAYIEVGKQSGLDVLEKNTTLNVKDHNYFIQNINGEVRNRTCFYITDTEKMKNIFQDPSGEIVIAIISTDKTGTSKTYSQKWVYPNIWVAYAQLSGVTPHALFEGICQGKKINEIITNK